ncbi:MAG: nitrate/nitrite transporter NrtS [Paracoccaceae bacterium]
MSDTFNTRPSALQVALSPAVMRRAAKIAFVVGVILMFINHGDKIVMGHMTPLAWMKCALTFFVPYSVSTVTAILTARENQD